ncbi:hypothetical protein T4B_2459 [Trichinella pseudospiralis]|uniref:Uncharacterized protein n=1 Tax=Trichinella pseudospiralis TaxID=6337 RepID=A0A0V1E627_TRIPS|nr:hypothetical protein T4A_7832 [Trichinella pseudospiralis]KRZ25944.1 hypothetical protein T4B_2459 [Trichinella pseudospiralis]KRZ37253.1 hypothetical protein T4C_14058 [Trichinella pseudospiralis]
MKPLLGPRHGESSGAQRDQTSEVRWQPIKAEIDVLTARTSRGARGTEQFHRWFTLATRRAPNPRALYIWPWKRCKQQQYKKQKSCALPLVRGWGLLNLAINRLSCFNALVCELPRAIVIG